MSSFGQPTRKRLRWEVFFFLLKIGTLLVVVDLVVVVLVRTRMRKMMVISSTLRTMTLLARKRVKRTLKKRKIFAHLHTCNHLTADLDKILYFFCVLISILVSLLEPSIIW